ncbi:MAG: hypothetical protein HY461_00885, partial [Parcubacteria group bacterium]|nr:hypothetical protein [Parcubacteria group bacterium]
VGAATTVDLLRLLTHNRDIRWSKPKEDVYNKIDVWAFKEGQPDWAIQIKTDRHADATTILHADDATRVAVDDTHAREIEWVKEGARTLADGSIPLVITIAFNPENIDTTAGIILPNKIPELRKQLKAATAPRR